VIEAGGTVAVPRTEIPPGWFAMVVDPDGIAVGVLQSRSVAKEMTMPDVPYGFEKRLERTAVDQALERVTAALKTEGFGVLTSIDVRATLAAKLEVEFRRYLILGACNPTLAHRALTLEPQIGLLLPCNVVVQEAAGGATIVSIADPRAMFALVENPALAAVAEEADARLRRVLATL
jgi:uncharacterized protein (DUF302 family)